MRKIDVMKIEQSNLSGIEKIAELQAQTTIKVNELVEGYNKISKKLEGLIISYNEIYKIIKDNI